MIETKLDKRYLLFSMTTYYPGGGLGDKIGSYDTLQEVFEAARQEFTKSGCDWIEIYDRIMGVEVPFNE